MLHLKCGQAPCTFSAIVGPASQTELSASDALALCVLWHGACLVETGFLFFPFSMMLVFPFWFYHVFFLLFSGFDLYLVPLFLFSLSFNTCGFSGFIFVVLLFTLTFVNNNKPSFCLAVLVLLIGIVLVQGCSYCALLCLCRSRGGHVLVCDNACVEALYIPRFNSLGGPLLV